MKANVNSKALATATKAKKAAAETAKADKSKAIQQQKVDMAKAVASDIGKSISNVVPIARAVAVATTGTDKGSGLNIDMTIKGAMPLAPAPDGTRLKSRHHTVSAEIIADTEKLFESNELGAEIFKHAVAATELQWRTAALCVAIAARLQRDGQNAMGLLSEFMTAISGLGKGMSMIRTNAIRDWFLKYAAVEWSKPAGSDEKSFVFSKKKQHEATRSFNQNRAKYFEERLAKPFWLVTPEQGYQKFDFDKAFTDMMKRAAGYAGMSETDRLAKFGKDGLSLGNFEAIKQLMLTIRKDVQQADEPKEETKPEEGRTPDQVAATA